MRPVSSVERVEREHDGGWRGLGAIVSGLLEKLEVASVESKLQPVRVTARPATAGSGAGPAYRSRG